jgi:hypothetical protein
MVVLSRRFPDAIKENLCDYSRILLDADFDGEVSKDVENYVFAKVKELSRAKQYPLQLETYVRSILMRRYESTFL